MLLQLLPQLAMISMADSAFFTIVDKALTFVVLWPQTIIHTTIFTIIIAILIIGWTGRARSYPPWWHCRCWWAGRTTAWSSEAEFLFYLHVATGPTTTSYCINRHPLTQTLSQVCPVRRYSVCCAAFVHLIP